MTQASNDIKSFISWLQTTEVINHLKFSFQEKFTLFDIIHKTESENVHSDIIAWLLNPNPEKNHKLGHFFLKMFLDQISKITPLPIIENYADFKIKREDPLRGKRIDILITSEQNKLLIAIENKIKSSEGIDQLKNYYRIITQDFSKYDNKIYFYLTPFGDNPSNDKWIPLDYGIFVKTINKTMENKQLIKNSKVQFILEEYLELLQRDVLMDNKEIDQYWDELYPNVIAHDSIFFKILERKKKIIKTIKDFLEDLIDKYGLLPDSSKEEGKGFLVCFTTPNLEKHYKNLGDKTWSEKKRIVKFEFWLNRGYEKNFDELSIVFVIGPGEEKARKKLFSLVESNLDFFRYYKNQFDISKVYRKELWHLKDYKNENNMKIEIENKFKEFLENDLKKIEEKLT